MSSGRPARRRQHQRAAGRGRLKLPDGTSVEIPDPGHPGWDALRRLREGEGRPGDERLLDELLAVSDMRYWRYMSAVSAGPRDTADILPGNGVIRSEQRPPAVNAVLRQLADQAAGGDLGMCAHIRARAPQPAMWLAWAPRKLRCPGCAREAGRKITGTAADYRCDVCGHIGKRVSKLSLLTPPLEHQQVVVPVLVIFALCDRCAGPDVIKAQQANAAAGDR
jgi:hypothetical protein